MSAASGRLSCRWRRLGVPTVVGSCEFPQQQQAQAPADMRDPRADENGIGEFQAPAAAAPVSSASSVSRHWRSACGDVRFARRDVR
jgi:hypothetical protein